MKAGRLTARVPLDAVRGTMPSCATFVRATSSERGSSHRGVPGEELVLDYADGRLPAAELQRLELHFDACAAYTSVLAALAHRTTIGRGSRALAHIHPGTTVDRYLVRRQIGRGSMGVVFEAYDPELDRRVALEVIRPPPGGIDAEERDRVLQEARALARLSHPNVVPVLTVGARGDEIFVVMELVEGTSSRRSNST